MWDSQGTRKEARKDFCYRLLKRTGNLMKALRFEEGDLAPVRVHHTFTFESAQKPDDGFRGGTNQFSQLLARQPNVERNAVRTAVAEALPQVEQKGRQSLHRLAEGSRFAVRRREPRPSTHKLQ